MSLFEQAETASETTTAEINSAGRSTSRRWSIASAPRPDLSAAFVEDAGVSWLFAILEALLIIFGGVSSGIVYSLIALGSLGPIHAFVATAVLVAVLFCGAIRLAESNRRLRAPQRHIAIRDDAIAWIGAFLLFAFVVFSVKNGPAFSRGAVLTFFFSGFILVEIFRFVAPRVIREHYGRRAFGWNELLLVGADTGVVALERNVLVSGFVNFTSVRIDPQCDRESWPHELRQGISRVVDMARTSRYGEIYVSAEGFSQERLRDLISGLQVVPRAVRLVPELATARLLQMPVHSIGHAYAVELQKAPLSRFQWSLKRAMDLALAAPAAVLALPLLGAIALIIKLDSPGPVIYRQKRLGYRSEPFDILKFRTMSVLEYGEDIRAASQHDRRVTRVGRFLRKASLDELPQLLNVIRGQMSLVGPRPHACAHDVRYAALIENYELRQHVKPGITGWAQVNGLRGETANLELMRQRVEYDIWYAKNATITLDVVILARTVVEVFRHRNAY